MTYDYAIIGAGVFGLTLARQLANVGRSVIVFDQGAIGQSGASAGLLGALMPASPLVRGPLATVQWRCLQRYPDRIAQLKLETGYKRNGRVQPLLTEQSRLQYEQQAAACADRWHNAPKEHHLRVIDQAELQEDYPKLVVQLAPAPFGYAVDGVSAQVAPRKLLTALTESIAGRVDLHAHTRVQWLEQDRIITDRGTYRARQIIVTAGWQSAALTDAPVSGVKGQACATAPLLSNAPLLYTRNGYIVFHDDYCALGSTTEKQWHDAAPDLAVCATIRDRAAQLLPVLATQSLTECWAGIRPKSTGALPLIARMSEHVTVATGGYKIGLALAFELADWIAAAVAQDALAEFWAFVAAAEKFDFSKHA